MIVASALVELAGFVAATDPARSTTYLGASSLALDSAAAAYLQSPAASYGVLRNGTVTYPQAGIAIVYGDYYFLEALRRWEAIAPADRAAAEASAAARRNV